MANFSMKLHMNPNFTAVIARSPGVQLYLFKIAEKLKTRAREEFNRQVKHTHPVTLPPYEFSFFVMKMRNSKNLANWVVGNNDPAAVMVEFGSHPGGGPTQTLAYHPLGKALDSLAGGA